MYTEVGHPITVELKSWQQGANNMLAKWGHDYLTRRNKRDVNLLLDSLNEVTKYLILTLTVKTLGVDGPR